MLPPPRGGFCRLSWGCAVLRGLKRAHLGRVWVAPGPYGVSTPCRHSASAPSPSRSCGRPPMDFRSPTELDHRDPAPSRHPKAASQTTLPLLDFFCPTARTKPAEPSAGGGSLRHRVPRTGFDYPLRDVSAGPAGATSAPERPWASPFKGFPSSRSVPLSEPMPSWRCRAAAAPPRRAACRDNGRLQGLVPVTSPC